MNAERFTSSGDFKTLIRMVVDAYKRQYADEYKLLCQAVQMRRKIMKNERSGIVTENQRALYEISDTLHAALITTLSVEALTWFKEKEGGRWFATAFPEFRLPSHL